MVSIRDVLNLDQWPDLVVGQNGYAARRRIDIAPLAYEIKINAPLSALMIEELIEYAGRADANLSRDLFSLCNGIRVGATKFAVYGVLRQIDRASDDVALHPPLDINVPNIYGRPKGWPDEFLIVGSSTEDGVQAESRKMIHAITPYGSIIVAEEYDYAAVSRGYLAVGQWLAAEVDRALSDANRY